MDTDSWHLRGIFVLVLLLLTPLGALMAQGDSVPTTSYSHSINAQSTWSEIKVVPNAFDSSNASASFIEANRCDGGSATCTSGESFIEVDFTVQFSSNSTRADVRWAMIAPESLPTDAKGFIHLYNQTSGTWELKDSDTTISGSPKVTEIEVGSHGLDGSNNIELRLSVRHNGTTFPADELAMYFYGVYDVREDIVDADGDGVLDEDDACPNGETGWTSTPATDYDGDGCRDATEDNDDDNDAIQDGNDDCTTGDLGWLSNSGTDNDGDGCRDLSEDEDDDNDGYNDTAETLCNSDPFDAMSLPTNDLDGDMICDAQDNDIDGDGLDNTVETNDSSYIDSSATGTNPYDADSDEDGYCDGDTIPTSPSNVCAFTDDAFPTDGAAYLDTDGDGQPDELWGTSTTGLVEDLDDDNDDWTDVEEAECGNTNAKDEASFPVDGDNDGVCDLLDDLTLIFEQNGSPFASFETYVGHLNFELTPNLTGMEAMSWELEGLLPNDFQFDNGTISGAVVTDIEQFEVVVWANNSETGINLNTTVTVVYLGNHDGDALPDGPSSTGLTVDDDDDNDNIIDGDDACPQGEIGLSAENDTDGNGCRDIFVFNLADITGQTNLTFFENATSPLPEGCDLSGDQFEILTCTNASNLGRSSNVIVDAEEFCNRILALELQNDEMEQWYDICPNNDGADVKSERENPLDAMELYLDFRFILNVDIDELGRPSVFGNASPVVALNFSLQNELPEGIFLLPEGGILDGAPTQLGNNTRVEIIIEIKGFPQSNRTQVVEFDIVDVAPVFQKEVTITIFNGEIVLNDHKTQGGEVTSWSILEGIDDLTNLGLSFEAQEGLIRGSIPSESATALLTVQGSNSGGVSTYTLLLDIDAEEVDESDPWLMYAFALVVLLALIVIFVQMLNKKEDPPLNPPSPSIGTYIHMPSGTIERSAFGTNASVENQSDSGVDLKEEFAQWALDQLSTPTSQSTSQPPALLQHWIEGLTVDDSLEVKIGFAPGYPRDWPNYLERAKQVTFEFMSKLLVYGGTFTPNVGGFVTDDKEKWMLVEPSLAFVSRVPFMKISKELPNINRAIASFCEQLFQHSVIVSIGPYKARFCNPNGEDAMNEIDEKLAEYMESGQKLQTPLPPKEILEEFEKL